MGANRHRVHPSVHLAAESWSTVNQIQVRTEKRRHQPPQALHARSSTFRSSTARVSTSGRRYSFGVRGLFGPPDSRVRDHDTTTRWPRQGFPGGRPFTCVFRPLPRRKATKRTYRHPQDHADIAVRGTATTAQPPNARSCATRQCGFDEWSCHFSWPDGRQGPSRFTTPHGQTVLDQPLRTEQMIDTLSTRPPLKLRRSTRPSEQRPFGDGVPWSTKVVFPGRQNQPNRPSFGR
jgi:hypothetical protein